MPGLSPVVDVQAATSAAVSLHGSNLTLVVIVAVIARHCRSRMSVYLPQSGAGRRRGHRQDAGDRGGGPGGRQRRT